MWFITCCKHQRKLKNNSGSSMTAASDKRKTVLGTTSLRYCCTCRLTFLWPSLIEILQWKKETEMFQKYSNAFVRSVCMRAFLPAVPACNSQPCGDNAVGQARRHASFVEGTLLLLSQGQSRSAMPFFLATRYQFAMFSFSLCCVLSPDICIVGRKCQGCAIIVEWF